MTLNDLHPGSQARIRRHLATGAVRQRLMDLGLMPGASLELIRFAPLGDPIEVRLDSAKVTLRRAEAATIEVEAPVVVPEPHAGEAGRQARHQ